MSLDLVTLLEQNIKPYLAPESKVVLALSGGVDSRVLLDLLARLRWTLSIQVKAVHVHHGLSAHADSWARLCQYWCHEAGIDYCVERVSVAKDSRESLENLARQARYQALAQHLSPGDLLLTGQHSDDQLETFLLALKRGSGPKGLSSMAQVMPFHQAKMIRPLLTVSRQEIKNYAVRHELDWIEDESNQDIRFDRNFIRHRIAPVITQRWPSFPQAVQRSAELCARQEALINELLQDKLESALHADLSLSVSALAGLSVSARGQLLRMWLARLNRPMPSQIQLEHIWSQVALAKEDANPKIRLDNVEIRRFEQRLYCLAQVEDISGWQASVSFQQPLNLPDNLGTISLSPALSGNRSAILLNRSALTGDLTVCFNPEGLMACPVGRAGQKKLKKWFQEFSVPSWLRRRTPILLCGDQVVAVADLFADRRFCGEDCELVWGKRV